MRGIIRLCRPAVAAVAVALAFSVAGCGDDDDCKQIIKGVPNFTACEALAEQYECSSSIVFRPANPNRTSACHLENCTPCRVPPTPTAIPVES
jgi:hypothetical protein